MPQTKRILIVGSALIILGTAAAVFAVPVTFQAGTLLKSADLNKDFSDLDTRVTAATVVTVGSKSYSLGAVFKKATQPIHTGNLGGYAGAKSICEAAVGTPTAHMCTGEELVRSAQLGISVPAGGGWYSSAGDAIDGTSPGQTQPNRHDDDCQGWTDNSTVNNGTTVGTSDGPTWIKNTGVPQGRPFHGDCSTSNAVLCCD